MEVTKRNLALTFGTPAKIEELITISNPTETLSGTQAKDAMSKALSSDAIGENVQANSIVGAKYMIQQVDAIDLDAE